jgi:TIR domain
MIHENAVWLNFLPSEYYARQVSDQISGKWLCFGPKEQLHLYSALLDKLVEEGVFKAAKLAKKDPQTDPFPHKDCVLCIFTSDNADEKTRVYDKLRDIGLSPKPWKSNMDTLRDWEPGVGALSLERDIVRKKRGIQQSEHDRKSQPEAERLAYAPKTLFVSYRHEDAAGSTGRLCDQIRTRHGSIRLFLDVTEIKPGEDFIDQSMISVASSDACLAVIGKGWLTAHDGKGRRRIDDPNDIVRAEIAGALSLGIPVIPVLVDQASMPRSEELPVNLRPLTRRAAVEISHVRFAADVDRLVSDLIGASRSRA